MDLAKVSLVRLVDDRENIRRAGEMGAGFAELTRKKKVLLKAIW